MELSRLAKKGGDMGVGIGDEDEDDEDDDEDDEDLTSVSTTYSTAVKFKSSNVGLAGRFSII
jgi:hypothetical protein